MVRDERAEVASTWAHEKFETGREGHVDKRHGVRIARHGDKHSDTRGGAHGVPAVEKYREIDHELRRIAKQRTALDVQEARWLREADRYRVWRKLGFSTALEYLEDVFGYAPRTAMERLRVANELGKLPQLEAELESGTLPYSAAKELSRVMTPETQAAWLAGARGKNLRDIEEMVAGRKKGDSPDAPPDPGLIVHDVRLKLTARSKALWEQMQAALETECDGRLEDDQLVEIVTRRVLGGDASPSDKPSRPAHRIVVHKCDDCGRAWQEARGRRIELSEPELAVAECDAMIVHETDHAAGDQSKPARTTSDIPEKTRKRVWARDKGRCCIPGCRATRHLDLHHIIPRELGGTHDDWNLSLTCSGHHQLTHQGDLSITGRAPDALVITRNGKRLVDPRSTEALSIDALRSSTASPTTRSRFADVARLEHAKQALRQLGLSTRAAGAALKQASAHVDANADVAKLVQTAFELSRPQAQYAESGTRETVDDDTTRTMAAQALVQLGYPRPVAIGAVNAACAHVGSDDLATLIKDALQRTGL